MAPSARSSRSPRRGGSCGPSLLVGLPLRVGTQLFNVAAVHGGRVLGVVAEVLPAELPRVLRGALVQRRRARRRRQRRVARQDAPFGTDIVFEAADLAGFALRRRDLRGPLDAPPPSTLAALAGATVVANLSASNITVGKAGYAASSARPVRPRLAAYVYVGAGKGESTPTSPGTATRCRRERQPARRARAVRTASRSSSTADIDLERLAPDRMRHDELRRLRSMTVARLVVPTGRGRARRARRRPSHLGATCRFPYVPADPRRAQRALRARCTASRCSGLATRSRRAASRSSCIGVSGGLDSTQALLVARGHGRPRPAAHERAGLHHAGLRHVDAHARATPHADGRARRDAPTRSTSGPSRSRCSGPRPSAATASPSTTSRSRTCRPASAPRPVPAREPARRRSSSAPATCPSWRSGWSTYGVGDHMSHYGVNGSVPKTLIQYLIRWVAERGEPSSGDARDGARRRSSTPTISPELIPPARAATRPAQRSEDASARTSCRTSSSTTCSASGSAPRRSRTSPTTRGATARGDFPALLPTRHNEYDLATICRWLQKFLAALPREPVQALGAAGRAEGRLRRIAVAAGRLASPSDASAAAWLDELDAFETARARTFLIRRSGRLLQELQQPGGGAAQGGIDDLRGLAVEVLEPGVRAPGDVGPRARPCPVAGRPAVPDRRPRSTTTPMSASSSFVTCSAMAVTARSDTTGPSGTSSRERFAPDA